MIKFFFKCFLKIGVRTLGPHVIFILDASAILSLQQIFSFKDDQTTQNLKLFTTPQIIKEFKDNFTKLRIESMISSKELEIMTPSTDSLYFIEEQCLKIGNLTRLSKEDKNILALAKQESTKFGKPNVTIFTDDYEIQNTASLLGFKFKPIRTKGISYNVKFRMYCADCKTQVDQNDVECLNCGSINLKLKRIKKKITNIS